MKKLSQRGDTIIEVLISMAVISIVLGGAFTATRLSSTGVQDSQEHSQALGLVQTQIELLRADASSSKPTIFTYPINPFCMYINNTYTASTVSPATGDCVQNASGTPTTTQPAFHLLIARDNPDSNNGYLFTVTATWSEVNGSGQASESMVYRLYK
jgi:prepilin-type N-terminal cleavage/methylation domain-containing protein